MSSAKQFMYNDKTIPIYKKNYHICKYCFVINRDSTTPKEVNSNFAILKHQSCLLNTDRV